jgi:hypothetical protein
VQKYHKFKYFYGADLYGAMVWVCIWNVTDKKCMDYFMEDLLSRNLKTDKNMEGLIKEDVECVYVYVVKVGGQWEWISIASNDSVLYYQH